MSYTRFSIARQTDGDNSHVEMKLSADDEEGGEAGRPEHLHAHVAQPWRNGKNLCFLLIAAFLLLLIGKKGWETNEVPGSASCSYLRLSTNVRIHIVSG